MSAGPEPDVCGSDDQTQLGPRGPRYTVITSAEFAEHRQCNMTGPVPVQPNAGIYPGIVYSWGARGLGATCQNSLHAVRSYQPGHLITPFHAQALLPQPNMYTLQVSEARHCELGPDILQYMNHSCSPNMFVYTEANRIEAIADIAPGDQLTFFYPSTEWDMESPFTCRCASLVCLGCIQGAKHLPPAKLDLYRLNSHIHRMLSLHNSQGVQRS